MVQPTAVVTRSFGDMTSPNESHDLKNDGKNPDLSNDLADFEKFDLEHPTNTKTIFAITAAVYPGDGITLRTTALRVM